MSVSIPNNEPNVYKKVCFCENNFWLCSAISAQLAAGLT